MKRLRRLDFNGGAPESVRPTGGGVRNHHAGRGRNPAPTATLGVRQQTSRRGRRPRRPTVTTRTNATVTRHAKPRTKIVGAGFHPRPDVPGSDTSNNSARQRRAAGSSRTPTPTGLCEMYAGAETVESAKPSRRAGVEPRPYGYAGGTTSDPPVGVGVLDDPSSRYGCGHGHAPGQTTHKNRRGGAPPPPGRCGFAQRHGAATADPPGQWGVFVRIGQIINVCPRRFRVASLCRFGI